MSIKMQFCFSYENVLYIIKRGEVILMDKNEIIIYVTTDHSVKLNVNTYGDTIFMNRVQLAER